MATTVAGVTGTPSSKPAPHPRRPVLIAAAAAVLLIAAGSLFDRQASPGTRRMVVALSVGQALEVHRGKVAALRDIDGIDLDQGRLTSQATAGIDITPWGQGNHLVTKSGASMVLLDTPGAESYQRCAAVPAQRLVTSIRGLYAVPANRNLCVWTREGHVAMLTLDETPSPRTASLALRYVVWEPSR